MHSDPDRGRARASKGRRIFVVAGSNTQVRVINVGNEDLMYVLAMNRMRAAYVDIDPGIEPYFMASTYDDEAGSVRTYEFFGTRTTASHVIGSSMVLIIVVNAILLGLLAAAISLTAGAPSWLTFTIGGVVAGAVAVVAAIQGQRGYLKHWREYRPLNPSPKDSRDS